MRAREESYPAHSLVQSGNHIPHAWRISFLCKTGFSQWVLSSLNQCGQRSRCSLSWPHLTRDRQTDRRTQTHTSCMIHCVQAATFSLTTGSVLYHLLKQDLTSRICTKLWQIALQSEVGLQYNSPSWRMSRIKWLYGSFCLLPLQTVLVAGHVLVGVALHVFFLWSCRLTFSFGG